MPYHAFIMYKRIPNIFTNFMLLMNNKKYPQVKVDDDIIRNISFATISTYYNYFSKKYKRTNLNYYGITIIPPTSLNQFLKVIKSQNNLVFNDLIKMTEEAIVKNYCLIHYGI